MQQDSAFISEKFGMMRVRVVRLPFCIHPSVAHAISNAKERPRCRRNVSLVQTIAVHFYSRASCMSSRHKSTSIGILFVHKEGFDQKQTVQRNRIEW
jgi:hypothetical protein